MDNNQTLTLVKGEFTPNETAEILLSLINEKIRFHDLQILGINEGRAGDPNPHIKRLEELKSTKNQLRDIIEQAKRENATISINSTINLEIKVPEEVI